MKKRHFQIFLLLFAGQTLSAQTTITLTPSEDAAIGFHDGTSSANNNYGTAAQNAAFWVPASASPPPGVNGNRALMKFSFASIPPAATITAALLNLYSIPIGVYPGHFGTKNDCSLERITQSWSETAATWSNQPVSTTLNSVTLPQSTSATQDYTNVNVLNLVLDIMNNQGSSFGFKLKLNTESVSNGLLFASKDHTNQALWPKLVITYVLPVATGISENTNGDAVLQIFPNPAGTEVNIANLSDVSLLTFKDISGMILTEIVPATGALKMDISDFSNGLYFCEIRDQNGSIAVKKFTVMH